MDIVGNKYNANQVWDSFQNRVPVPIYMPALTPGEPIQAPIRYLVPEPPPLIDDDGDPIIFLGLRRYVGLAIRRFSPQDDHPDDPRISVVNFNMDSIEFMADPAEDLNWTAFKDPGDFYRIGEIVNEPDEGVEEAAAEEDSLLTSIIKSLCRFLMRLIGEEEPVPEPEPESELPGRELEFSDIRDEEAQFGFSFFTFTILESVIKYSEQIILSGAYIRPGIKGFPHSSYDDKPYFTLKIEGDMQRVVEERAESFDTTTAQLLSRTEVREDFENGTGAYYGRTFDLPLIEEVTGQEGLGMPSTVLGHPCPPYWEPPDGVMYAIRQVLQTEGRLFLDENGNLHALVLSPVSNEVQYEPIEFFRYMELVKAAWIEFCSTW